MTLTTFIVWLALASRSFFIAPLDVAFIVGDDPRADCLIVRVSDHSIEIPYCTFGDDARPRVAGAQVIARSGLSLSWSNGQ